MFSQSKDKEKLLFKNAFLTLAYDESEGILMSDWSGWLDTKKGKSGCLEILSYVNQHGVTKILNDNSSVTGTSGETDWMTRVWIPSLRDAGLLYFAWVYSREFFTQLQIDNTVDKSTGIAMRTFFSTGEALQWLKME